MRIGILTYDYVPAIGGLGIVAEQLERHLRKNFTANEYLVFSPSHGATETVSRLARWRWKKKGGCPMFSLSLFWTLPGMIKKRRIDVLHVHAGSGGVWLLRKPSVPLVVTAHHSYAQEAASVYRGSPLAVAWKRLMAALEKRTYGYADHITCVSADTRRVLIEVYGVPAAKVSVIENAVDLQKFTSDPAVVKNGKTVLFAGRLEPRKGIWVFVRAMGAIRKAVPGVRFRLIGQNLIGHKLRDVVRQQGLDSCCEFLGRVHEPFLIRELQDADVVVVPSLIEGFGLIAAEAMACGACVVASDCDGLRSLIDNRRTGMLFPTGDAEACATTVNHVLLDAGLRLRLAEAAGAEAHKRFSFTRQAADMQASLERVWAAAK
ncbi:MAG TPA: glycosyltransferase family 4 protein [Candidatus Peribacteria bacterium]|nr:glycosyltransferase family 4 protein [Candidatus Peribacteria bacterium]